MLKFCTTLLSVPTPSSLDDESGADLQTPMCHEPCYFLVFFLHRQQVVQSIYNVLKASYGVVCLTKHSEQESGKRNVLRLPPKQQQDFR